MSGTGLRAADGAPAAEAPPARPKLVDLGADKCIPCKMMAPVLAELAREYAGQLDVVFIDVWKTRGEGERYGIRVIPTQIFYSAEGKELFRHEGYFAKKDILAKWKALGVELREPAAPKGE
jgi:thioredoxin 1